MKIDRYFVKTMRFKLIENPETQNTADDVERSSGKADADALILYRVELFFGT